MGQQVMPRPPLPIPPTHLHLHPTQEEVLLDREPPGSNPLSGIKANPKGSSTNQQLGQLLVSHLWRLQPN